MAITKAYNHNNGVYYAYETTYQWNEEKQKKVAVRKCIGHFDEVTGEVVPNGSRGRKPIYPRKETVKKKEEVPQENTASNGQEYNNEDERLVDLYRDIVQAMKSMAAYYEEKLNKLKK